MLIFLFLLKINRHIRTVIEKGCYLASRIMQYMQLHATQDQLKAEVYKEAVYLKENNTVSFSFLSVMKASSFKMN